ncbi:C-type lectin 1 isoform X1 [Esox lucius]|uniref:C-type lectin 1 isoform X1 n=1 Tax=Esox lucius TaxID=8010 RepID=UPI0009733EC9|nr:C-type lectin 1 isoform X1 [Esox lucius]
MKMSPFLLLLCADVYCTGVYCHLRVFNLSEKTKLLIWTEARDYCHQHNFTDLATVYNQEESEMLNKLLQIGQGATIGLYRTHPKLKWSNGDPVNVTALLMPAISYTIPMCAATLKINLTWDDCTVNKYFMCYIKDQIHVINEKQTWEQALKYCNDNYTTLLRIESKNDQRVVEQSLRAANVPGPVWIGLRQSRLFGFWVWINGIPLKREDWSNWEGGIWPELPLSHQCGAMATKEGHFEWSDQDCQSSLYFICEG